MGSDALSEVGNEMSEGGRAPDETDIGTDVVDGIIDEDDIDAARHVGVDVYCGSGMKLIGVVDVCSGDWKF